MTSAYSNKDVEKLIDMYESNPCLEMVDKLAVLFNKPRKSIISKLCKEGVYVTRGYRSKTGETPVTKLQIVRLVEIALDTKLPGLDKAPKATLKALEKNVQEMATLLEDVLIELQSAEELLAVQKDMLSK
jgi:hypothetical protein